MTWTCFNILSYANGISVYGVVRAVVLTLIKCQYKVKVTLYKGGHQSKKRLYLVGKGIDTSVNISNRALNIFKEGIT